MHFKRTPKRSAYQIAQYLEALGGSINAFTSRENTCYYARILNQHLPKAMDVLGDILNNSTFGRGDLKKEKQVILEEIKDVADTPSDYIHDLHSAQMWKSHSLGQPIMGGADNIAGLKRSSVIKYIEDHYCSPNVVIAAAGDVSHSTLVKLAKRYFRWPKADRRKEDSVPTYNGFSVKGHRGKTKQTLVCMGFPSISFGDDERYALLAANTLLSGGMSSRLFQSVREKAGYCYTIYSFPEFFRDTGLFCVYYGSDDKYAVASANLVLKELNRMKNKLLSRSELRQVKEQLKGNLMLSQESTVSRMNRIARQELILGRYIDLDETIRNIDRITAKQVRDISNRIFNRDHLTFTSLGPTRTRDLETIKFSAL